MVKGDLIALSFPADRLGSCGAVLVAVAVGHPGALPGYHSGGPSYYPGTVSAWIVAGSFHGIKITRTFSALAHSIQYHVLDSDLLGFTRDFPFVILAHIAPVLSVVFDIVTYTICTKDRPFFLA